jgi:hypothetical protein
MFLLWFLFILLTLVTVAIIYIDEGAPHPPFTHWALLFTAIAGTMVMGGLSIQDLITLNTVLCP